MLRPLANHAMHEADYIDILQSWLQGFPQTSMSNLLGPLKMKPSEITPESLVRATPLIQKFVSEGASQCIFLVSRLENAVLHVLGKHKWASADQSSPATEAAMITQHLVVTSSMLRTIRREDEQSGKHRRFPKSSSLRRRMTSSDWAVVRPLLASIVLPGPETRPLPTVASPSKSPASSCSPSSAAKRASASLAPAAKKTATLNCAPEVEYDSNGFPIFRSLSDVYSDSVAEGKGILETTQAPEGQQPLQTDAEDLSSVAFDSEGWPVFQNMLQNRRSRPASAKPPLDQIASDGGGKDYEADAPIVAPRGWARKALALAVRPGKRQASSARTSAKVPKLSVKTPEPSLETPKPPYEMPEPSVDEVEFERVMSSQTSEKNARFEITAMIRLDNKPKRLHVATLTRAKWGDSFAEKGNALLAFCKKSGATKAKALEFRAALSLGEQGP